MYCGRCGKKIEGTAGICYYCQTRYTITAANLPCPSCAAKDAELKRLREDVELLLDYFDINYSFVTGLHLKRRAKEG